VSNENLTHIKHTFDTRDHFAGRDTLPSFNCHVLPECCKDSCWGGLRVAPKNPQNVKVCGMVQSARLRMTVSTFSYLLQSEKRLPKCLLPCKLRHLCQPKDQGGTGCIEHFLTIVHDPMVEYSGKTTRSIPGSPFLIPLTISQIFLAFSNTSSVVCKRGMGY